MSVILRQAGSRISLDWQTFPLTDRAQTAPEPQGQT